MAAKNIKFQIFFIGGAFLVNALMLVIIPRLSYYENRPRPASSFNAIRLSKYEPPSPQPPIQKKRPKPKEETPPRTIPQKVSVKPKKVNVRQPTMKRFEIPPINFSINPALKTGMAIAPPPEPVRQPDPTPVAEPVETVSAPVVQEAIPSEFGMDEVDQVPQILQKVEPVYPYRARRRNIKGNVTVKFLVSVSGIVKDPSIVNAEPRGIFEQSVLEAVRKWHFTPGYYKGRAVPTWVILPIQFNLSS